jgi:multimeric flavodoxin WrbA
MYALAINGSPRKGGNTECMLNHVLAPLSEAGWETRLIQVGGKPVRGCMACRKCAENQDKHCSITSDMFNEVMDEIVRADAMIIGSPTYFADLTAETKAVLDRAGYVSLTNGGLLAGKIGTAVAAARRGGAVPVFDSINHMYLMNRMIVPGSTYWNLGIGLDRKDVLQDGEALANMNNLGQTIAWLGDAIKPKLGTFPKATR